MASPSNTQRLKDLMSQHKLSPEQVSKMLGRSVHTVREWRCANSNNISDNNLELLELKLAARGAEA